MEGKFPANQTTFKMNSKYCKKYERNSMFVSNGALYNTE